MIYRTGVQSAERPESLVKDKDTVYKHFNVVETEEGFKYDEVEMTYDEFNAEEAQQANQDIALLGTSFAEYRAQIDLALAELSLLVGGGANV